MEQFLFQFFNLDIMIHAWPIMLRGFGMTLLLCAVVIPMGLVGGLLVALASTTPQRWIRWPTAVLVDLFRAVPPLALLIFISAGLPFAGIRLSPFTAVCLSFLLNNSAYYGEIYRAGIDSIGTGQSEAARSTGLNAFQSMAYVVLPQAVRNVLPDLVSNTIEVVKLTSLASVVAFSELLYSADMARSITYNASPIVMAAGFYLVLLWPAVRLASRLERKLST
ncbi:amino acid ABC transporter permease [Roseibium algae]|uniref:Amino acid ABC transporter permease n=1 Tax=Roseibium algae TaxID=3123038 RepID=A0ABU8TMI0_9HYPH